LAPVTASWALKAALVDTVAVPLVGGAWAKVPAVTVRVKLHTPVSPSASVSVPDTV
jgi:hypothetical protein